MSMGAFDEDEYERRERKNSEVDASFDDERTTYHGKVEYDSGESAEELLSRSVTAESGTETPDLDAIRADIQRVRDSGSVFSRGERDPDVVTVSSPIETMDAAPPAALAIVGPAERLQGRYLEEDLVGQLISTAEAISVAVAD